MGTKKGKADPSARQLPVRFSGADAHQLSEMQEHLGEDAATIIRWAINHYYKIVADAEWKITNHGEPIAPFEPATSPAQSHAPPSRKALPS